MTVGVAGFVALGKVTAKTVLYQNMSQVKSIFAEAREQVNQFTLKNYKEGRELQLKARQAALENFEKCKSLLAWTGELRSVWREKASQAFTVARMVACSWCWM